VRFKLADDIGGLAEGDPVRIGGAKVGTVRDISLETDVPEPGIVITFAMPSKFKLKNDAQVTIQSTVTGVAVLNFESLGSAAGAELIEGQMLTGKPGGSIASLTAAAQGFLGDARTVTLPRINTTIDTYKTTGESATDLIRHVRSKIDPIIERYNAIADKGTFALGEIGSLFSDTRSDFRGMMANVNAATGNIKEKLPGILEKTDGVLTKLQTALDKTNEALVDIRAVAADSREATASARSILVSNRGKIDAMIASLKTAGDNLKFATAEIRRSPWRLLYKPGPGEMANLNLYDSARQFAEGAGAMQDAAVALRDALKDPDSDPERLRKLVGRLDESFQQFTKVESALWQQVKE
jgi:ABC-type transporter Mla subunit MlaD